MVWPLCGGYQANEGKIRREVIMDEIRLAERIFKIIRGRQTQINEIITSNQVKAVSYTHLTLPTIYSV